MCRNVLVTLDTAGSLVINSLHHREFVAISNVACLIPNQNSFFFQDVKTNLKQFLFLKTVKGEKSYALFFFFLSPNKSINQASATDLRPDTV